MSIFTVLSEQNKNMPSSTNLIVKCSGNEEQEYGSFNLEYFVNSGADKDTAAFRLAGRQEEVNLVELLKHAGHTFNEKEGDMIYNASKNIGIFINGEYKNLDGLKKSWKDQIIADSFGKDLISSTKVDKDVIKWLRTEAEKTAGGGEVCCYCGLVYQLES